VVVKSHTCTVPSTVPLTMRAASKLTERTLRDALVLARKKNETTKKIAVPFRVLEYTDATTRLGAPDAHGLIHGRTDDDTVVEL